MPSENNRRRTPSPKTAKPAQSSPFAGCLIIAAAFAVMVFLVAFTFWSLNRMESEIKTFTEEEARPTPVLDPVNFETEFNDLSRRLDGFKTAVQADEPARIELTPTDINLAISAHETFKNLRSTFYVTEINPESIAVQISYPMRGYPFGDGAGHYLNGTLEGVPELESGQILLQLTTIHSEKGTVPEQFVAHLSDHQITAPYLEDESMGPVLKRLTSVSLGEKALVLEFDPAAAPPGQQPITISEIEETKRKALTAFGVGGSIFLIFLILFLRKGRGKGGKLTKPSH